MNRVGSGGNIAYDGGSIAWDPWGDPVPEAQTPSGTRLVTVDPARVADIRGKYPFLRDMRDGNGE